MIIIHISLFFFLFLFFFFFWLFNYYFFVKGYRTEMNAKEIIATRKESTMIERGNAGTTTAAAVGPAAATRR